jgi:hypothetical protein
MGLVAVARHAGQEHCAGHGADARPRRGAAERLNDLRTIREKNLFTEEESQAKRRQILDRM